MVSAPFPEGSRTSRHPAWAVAAVPSVVGKLAAIHQPARNSTSAVVNPTPAVQVPARWEASIGANWLTVPPGDICIIVVPVPCRLDAALKLLMSKFPFSKFPTVSGTTKIPYGFTSPFAGLVKAITVIVCGERAAGDSAAARPWNRHGRASTDFPTLHEA